MSEQQSDWEIFESVSQGLPRHCRIRKSEIPASLPILCVIEWRYAGEDQNGMPDPATRRHFIAFEHAIAALIDSLFSRLVLVTTSANVREWAFYVSDREVFMKQFNTLMSAHPRVPIRIIFASDAAHAHWRRSRHPVAD